MVDDITARHGTVIAIFLFISIFCSLSTEAVFQTIKATSHSTRKSYLKIESTG